MSSFADTRSDTVVLARRNLKRIPRQPDLLVAYTVQPIMFTLLFVYVFGGAISTPGFDYVDFLMPGILVMLVLFATSMTGFGLLMEMQSGSHERLMVTPLTAHR